MSDTTFDISGGNNQLLPNAQQASQYFIGDSAIRETHSQLARFRQAIGDKISEPTRDRIRFYETKLKGSKDMEEKLRDGGFKPSAIEKAKRLKEYWAKEAFRTSDYPVIQEDNFNLYSRIATEFDIYIMPMIEDRKPLRDVMQTLHEKIVCPIMDIFRETGYNDDSIRYTYDHIYGMIYYLTGNCHLNWKDYDNL